MRRPEIRPLAQVRFAEDDCSGRPQPFGNVRIARRNRSLERVRPGGRRHFVVRVDVVLDQHGNSVHRPARAFLFSLLVESLCDRESIGIRLDHAAKRWTFSVVCCDSSEIKLGYRLRRAFATRHVALQLRDRRFLEIEIRCIARGCWLGRGNGAAFSDFCNSKCCRAAQCAGPKKVTAAHQMWQLERPRFSRYC
jgi:hypothetical protein